MHNQVGELKIQRAEFGWKRDLPSNSSSELTGLVRTSTCLFTGVVGESSLDPTFDVINYQKFRNNRNRSNESLKLQLIKVCVPTKRQFVNREQERSNRNMEWGLGVYCYKADHTVRKQWLVYSVISYNIHIFVNDRELDSGYLISILVNSLNFA